MTTAIPVLAAKGLVKSYPMGSGRLEILKGIDLEIHRGDAVAIVGASGAGKSTLLQILGTLDRPSLGRVLAAGKDLTTLADEELSRFRNQKMGFVFQFHHLLPEFTALENVALPLRIAGWSRERALKEAALWLVEVGLSERLAHSPSELSGGEQQRVAIARALVRRPEVVLADEPTGNLDSANAQRIQDLLFQLRQKHNVALVVVTHDTEFAKRFPRRLTMVDGAIATPKI